MYTVVTEYFVYMYPKSLDNIFAKNNQEYTFYSLMCSRWEINVASNQTHILVYSRTCHHTYCNRVNFGVLFAKDKKRDSQPLSHLSYKQFVWTIWLADI